jgi:glycosyltransferase 2 family protein
MQAYDSTHWSCASPPDSVAIRSPSSRWRLLISVLGIVLVARVLWGVDFSHVAALLRSRGLALVAVLLPFLMGMAVDTAAWRLILLRLGRVVQYGRLLRLRIASEALFLTVPGGSVAAEVAKPLLLSARTGVPLPDATASVFIKKLFYVAAHACYIAAALVLGHRAVTQMASALGAGSAVTRAFPVLAAITLTCQIGIVIGLAVLWVRAGLGGRFLAGVRRLKLRRIGAWIEARTEAVMRFESSGRTFFRPGARAALPVALLLFCQWVTETGETFLILRLLGVDAAFTSVMAFEALNSFLRSILFLLPAGLGVQDAGQMLFVRAIGTPEAATVGAALVLCKRAKDAVWGLAGYTLMSLRGRAA